MNILSMMIKRKFTKQLLRPELKLQGVLKTIQRKTYESDFKNVPFLASQLIEKLLKIKNAKDKKPEGDSKNKPALSYLKQALIPKDIKDDMNEKLDDLYSTIAEKFIGALQAPHESEEVNRKAAEIGLKLALFFKKERDTYFPQTQAIQKRFYALVVGMRKNPDLKAMILEKGIEYQKLVTMSEGELVSSDAYKQKAEQILHDTMQAARTDAALDRVKENMVPGMYKCKHCGGGNVSMYTQQTRGADEPMTEFYKCLSCHKQWKICP